MNERGQYGSALVGQAVPVYIEQESTSTTAWILGTIAAAAALLWARHQSQQIEQLYKKENLPYQGFTSSLRQSAASSLRGLAERARPKRKESSS